MTPEESLPFRAGLEEYQQQAEALFQALQTGDEAAHWKFKWMHPRYRGKTVSDVKAAELVLADAQLVIAQEYAFQTWTDLAEFTEAVKRDERVARFETAVEAVVAGDVPALKEMLREDSGLVRARSPRRHRATLLHYIAANGVEGGRQKTPPNAVEIAKLLLDARCDPDALAYMYDHQCTTMSMLVSSGHPHQAGLQGALAEVLLDYGASLEGPGSEWQSAVMTALAFGYLDTAQTLARRGATANNIAAAAGLGRLEEVGRLLPAADSLSRQIALALAAQHGHTEVVRLLLDAGEDPNRYNPDGFHSHSTPLHQAICSNHEPVVRLLVERGAKLDIRDTIYQGTPLGWAEYLGKTAIAQYLRGLGAP